MLPKNKGSCVIEIKTTFSIPRDNELKLKKGFIVLKAVKCINVF